METMRLLVVDDEPEFRGSVARMLAKPAPAAPPSEQKIRFVIEEAESGEEALERVQASPPDLILLDFKMPGMSGLDVLAHMASKGLTIPTIMVTGYASIQSAITATRQGAFDYLVKPVTGDQVRTVLGKAATHILLARETARLQNEKRKVRFHFLSVLVHELKTPVAVIEGNLRIIRDRLAEGDPAVYERLVERSLIRLDGLKKMILDLLELTGIESGERPRHLAPMDVREAALAVIEANQPIAQPRGIVLALHAPDSVRITADRSEIEMLLGNLVSNAVKYNRDGGRVDVTLVPDERGITIRVADTGIGMTHEEAERAFQEFVRIRNEQTRDILGTGLGLSIVKRIAANYGGTVTVESEPGKGSTFTVALPIPPAG